MELRQNFTWFYHTERSRWKYKGADPSAMPEVVDFNYGVVWGLKKKKHERLERYAIDTVKQSSVWLQT